MKKSILALIFLLFSGIAFSQTTVTLQDQCNCEVLKGTDVSSSGAVTPTGADLGDIYVNTNTGTIYFWDGNSWELTASDNQQLTGFTFNDVTNILSLSLEDGGNVNVDLSSLSDVFADSNTTVTSFGIDGTNTNLVIADSDSNSYAVALADLAALINTDNQTLNEVLVQGNDAGGSAITNLADPTAAQDAATKAYVDGFDTDDADADPTNELSDVALTGTTLELTNAAAGATGVDLDGTFATDAELAALDTDDADADPTNELSDVALTGTTLELTNAAAGATGVDLDGTFATDAELAALDTDDADADPTNEYNTGVSLNGTSIEVTDAGGTLSQDLDGTFATDAELAALDTDDADADPTNELSDVALTGTTLELTNAATGATGVDLDGTFATDAELAALDTDDADADPTNEYNTGAAMNAGSVEITDGGGTVATNV
ncbi:hypothetical protein, partial [Flagellimonas lutimaris]|uniref:hypothetical protein n=2 Tax=Flagellimonas lutimaris TaxID=475082 RepID=UPI003F5CE214